MNFTEKAENTLTIPKTRENTGKFDFLGCGISVGKMRKMPKEACTFSLFFRHIPKFHAENVSRKFLYFIRPSPACRTFSGFSVKFWVHLRAVDFSEMRIKFPSPSIFVFCPGAKRVHLIRHKGILPSSIPFFGFPVQ